MKSTISHLFSQIPQANIERSTFDRSHGHKTTFDAGYLIPVFVDEALPGDTFNLKMTAFARLSTPIKPIMDNIVMDSFFFAVPLRILWADFKRFMGEQTNPGDSTSYLVPQTAPPTGGYTYASLSDYFGIPTGKDSFTHSAFWHRGYNAIWNEWFRDENLQGSVGVPTDDGPDSYTLYNLLRRGKRKDYFTSSLPWPQKGTAVQLPMQGNAIIKTSTSDLITGVQTSGVRFRETTSGNPVASNVATLLGASTGTFYGATANGGLSLGNPQYPANLYADLSTVTAATVNQLRQAFQIQKLLERDARGGTRYIELVHSHFGVVSPDARQQRPEYLGGGSSPVNIAPVVKTASTDATSPQGNLAAYGHATIHGHGFVKSFTEHCVIIGLVCVRADMTYQQGLNKMFSRSTRYDYYWPALAHIGEQSILNQEIYLQGNASDTNVFGYQERYAEYRYKPSVITGKFRSTNATPLDVWHLAQNFTSLPTLGSTFIQENPPIARIQAVTTEPHFLFDSYFDLKCARPMPVYSVPGLIDHF